MTCRGLGILFFVLATSLGAEPLFWDRASALIQEGQFEEAKAAAVKVLEAQPDDADALVIAGTAVLYLSMVETKEESIYRQEPNSESPPTYALTPSGAASVAEYWKRVPALDSTREYLWGDLAQLTFRAGDSKHAMEFAQRALDAVSADPDSLRASAAVFALNLDWSSAAKALARIPGNRMALLYQGLDAWRRGKDGWKATLKAFADAPGEEASGSRLAAYLAGPEMRDGEAGFQAALKVEGGVAALAVKQKYVERYPDKFLPRLDLARSLGQMGSFDLALVHFTEIDRKGIAKPGDEQQTVLFQEAWAYQGSGKTTEAAKVWSMLTESKDFYLRSAALWFLGKAASLAGKTEEARLWWAPLAEEPDRSKYAQWAALELKKLR